MDNRELLNKFADAVEYYVHRHGGPFNKTPVEIFTDLMCDFAEITADMIKKEQ